MAEESADAIRVAIENERRPKLEKHASLRGCSLSEELRQRAQLHAAARLTAGDEPKSIARSLGIALGTLERWMRTSPAMQPTKPEPPPAEETEELRREIAAERKQLRDSRADLRGCRLSEALRKRAQEHTRARERAGAKLKSIAAELGVTVATLKDWTQPPPDGPLKLRPVRIIGPIDNCLAELTGPRLVLPSGVQIVGIDVDQMASLVKKLG
jgi:DNA-binding transcriptional regulator YiaG